VQNIFRKGDAFGVVKAVSFSERNLSRFGQLMKNIRMILDSLFSWQIHHISRVANNETHGLTEAVAKHIIDQVWMEEISDCICDIVLLEQSTLFF
jgi:hypothetical protein